MSHFLVGNTSVCSSGRLVDSARMLVIMISKYGLAATRPLIGIKDFEVDKTYKLVNAKLSKMKFGEPVLLELEEAVWFLPRSVTAVTKKKSISSRQANTD